jgi:hypothetical protein
MKGFSGFALGQKQKQKAKSQGLGFASYTSDVKFLLATGIVNSVNVLKFRREIFIVIQVLKCLKNIEVKYSGKSLNSK